MYGLQALLLFLMLRGVLPMLSALAASWAGATAFGLMTEALQTLRPERTAELGDVVADGVGAALVVVAIAIAGRDRRTPGDG